MKALVTGVTGQDGSYLSELLLEKGYEVHGLIRRSSSPNFERIQHLLNLPKFHLHEGDLTDAISLKKVIAKVQPNEVYNLAAMSHVQTSFAMPEYASDVNGMGVLRLLEAIHSFDPKIRFYQASTSELFGKVQSSPQSETTPFYPRSPYGVSKLYAYWAVVNFREAYGLYACNGILFNHESPRRGETFVSKKITMAVAHIQGGFQDKLILGNLDAKRDWGYAKDYVKGMWKMLQLERPEDFVLATGQTTTVRDFVELAFREIGVELFWEGKGIEEKGIDIRSKKVLVEVSSKFFRPTEVDLLIGDPSKANTILQWRANTSLKELVQLMVQEDIKKVFSLSTIG